MGGKAPAHDGGPMGHTQSRTIREPWYPDQPHVLEALREAEIGELELVGDSSNYVFVAELSHPERGDGLGVYKPERGERPLHDFPDGSLHRREVAAFELSQLLQWRLVPPTVEREGPYGVGSLQLFIEHDPDQHYFVLREKERLWPQLQQLAVFDIVANNVDRKGGHLLLGAGDRLWAIDNALCFHRHGKLRTVIWDFAGHELDTDCLRDLRRVYSQLSSDAPEADELLARLSADERVALIERIGVLIARPLLPEMFPWRCWPWPLI